MNIYIIRIFFWISGSNRIQNRNFRFGLRIGSPQIQIQKILGLKFKSKSKKSGLVNPKFRVSGQIFSHPNLPIK